jgi:hypothetical protein
MREAFYLFGFILIASMSAFKPSNIGLLERPSLLLADDVISVSAQDKNEIGLINRIDHIVFMVDDPVGLFTFLNKELKLPMAWDYENYGEFSCGGVCAGNINLESYFNPNDSAFTTSNITGIAFEPSIITDELNKKFDKLGVSYVGPFPFPEAGPKMWTNTILTELLPGSQIFVCEYHYPNEEYVQRRKSLNTQLTDAFGGPLGIEYVCEIKMEIKEPQKKNWETFLGTRINENEPISMAEGLDLRFVNSNENRIKSIKFKVRSLNKTRKHLSENGMLGYDKENMISTRPENTFGILFEFCETSR